MILRVLASIFACFMLMGPALAQMSVPTGSGSATETDPTLTLPEPLTQDAVREMVARMSDADVRALLLQRLDAVAAAAPESASQGSDGFFSTVRAAGMAVYHAVLGAILALPNLFSIQGQAFMHFAQSFEGNQFLLMWVYTAVALALGLAAEWITTVLSRRWQPEVPHDNSSLAASVRYLFRRFLRELLGLAAFYIVISFVGQRLLTADMQAVMGPMVFLLIWIPRITAAVSRFALAPERPDLRLVNVDDHWAKYIHRNLIGLAFLGAFTMWLVNFNVMQGVPLGEVSVGFWLTSAVHIYVGVLAWTARDGLRSMMLGSDPDVTRFDQVVSFYYPHFAILVSFVMWLTVEIIVGLGNPIIIEVIADAPQYLTMFYLLMAPVIDTTIRGLVGHLVPPMMGTGPIAENAYKSTKRSFIKIGRVIAGVIVLMMIGNAWEINFADLARNTAGENFGSNLLEALIVVAIGYMINELVSLYINRRLAKEQTEKAESMDSEEAAGEGGGAGGSRLSTVLPLVLVTAQVAIAVVFSMLALSALGLDITPLLAGAGVLGLAIGFGAQKLVADIVSGIFFLVDDAFRTGEYVDVSGTMGSVEKISIRSMQLRHHRGLVHTIPYGKIQKLTNFSRDWVIMKLKFTVPFDTDPNQVKKIFKKIGQEMLEVDEFKDSFIEPFKSQGVFDFDDVGMIIRGKFMAKPGTQFTLRKEIYNRVKAAFRENGIEFARREVRVAIPGLDEADLNEDQKTAIAAAGAGLAQQIVDEQAEAAAQGGAVKDDR